MEADRIEGLLAWVFIEIYRYSKSPEEAHKFIIDASNLMYEEMKDKKNVL